MSRFQKIFPFLVLILAMVLFVSTSFAQGGNFSLAWFTIDMGGGTSQSQDGVYSISGTIGQPDTKFMVGESIELSGGFWESTYYIDPPPGTNDYFFLPIMFR